MKKILCGEAGLARSLTVAAIALMLLTTAARPLTAQSAPALSEGVRVRVTTRSNSTRPSTGALLIAHSDSIALMASGYPLTIAWRDISRLEISRGKTSAARAAAPWAALGTLVGVVGGFGTIFGYACKEGITRQQCESDSNEVVNQAVVAGAIVGLVAGSAYGIVRRKERWHETTFPVRIGVGRLERGLAWSAAVPW